MYLSFICVFVGVLTVPRTTVTPNVSDQLMTLLWITDGLYKETKDTVSHHTVAGDVVVPSAVAVADLPSSPSILPMCL